MSTVLPRIAYLSPFPPQETGIATYSRHLVPALARHARLSLFNSNADVPDVAGMPVRNLSTHAEALHELGAADAIIYQLGNNPHFHLELYQALLARPGVVVLHDTVLYFLAAGGGRGALLKELCINHGIGQARELWRIIHDSRDEDILRYTKPERFPLLERVLSHATAVVVHSRTAAERVKAAGYRGPLHVIHLLAYPERDDLPTLRDQARARVGAAPGDMLIGTFGFGGRTKRYDKIVEAFARVSRTGGYKLLVVGAGNEPLLEDCARRGISDRVTNLGFVAESDFSLYLNAVDVIVNLRFPSMGETSATVTQAMQLGKPCIVSNHAWFAELPDDIVCKVSLGSGEVDEVEAALHAFRNDKAKRYEIGEAARRWVARHCDPDVVARAVVNAAVSAAPLSNERWLEQYVSGRIEGDSQ